MLAGVSASATYGWHSRATVLAAGSTNPSLSIFVAGYLLQCEILPITPSEVARVGARVGAAENVSNQSSAECMFC